VAPEDTAEDFFEPLAPPQFPRGLAENPAIVYRHASHTARKFRNISDPCCVCSTSGWNCTP